MAEVVVGCKDGSVTLSRSCAERLPLLKDILADVDAELGHDYTIPAESTMQELYHALSYAADRLPAQQTFTRDQRPGLMYWQVVDANAQPIDDILNEHSMLMKEKIKKLPCERKYNEALNYVHHCELCGVDLLSTTRNHSKFCAVHACTVTYCIRVRDHKSDHLCRKPNPKYWNSFHNRYNADMDINHRDSTVNPK